MTRYYFDIRENEILAVDEQGMDLADLKAAEVEAAQSLADMARNMPGDADSHHMAIEVRADDGPIFTATFVFKLTRH